MREGQTQQALDRVNRILVSRPKDPQARFLKGLILTDQGNTKDAIEVFQKLTQDFPELPEPYNNLAVIYASQGQFDRARSALEQSIRTHPSYATAYENLGDVYAKLASQAYDKALQLDTSNAGAQQKLALVRDLMGGTSGARGTKPAASAVVAAADSAKRSNEAPTPKAVSPQPPAAAIPAAPVRPTDDKSTAASSEVAAALNDWARAWSRREVDAYLSFYAKSFRPSGGQPRAEWEKSRKDRLLASRSISVALSHIQTRFANDREVSVTFRQSYRSDKLTANTLKQMELVKSGDRWLIQKEKVGN
jgi:Flp pilus assembly protein TadD